jgi:hypothetical protein
MWSTCSVIAIPKIPIMLSAQQQIFWYSKVSAFVKVQLPGTVGLDPHDVNAAKG